MANASAADVVKKARAAGYVTQLQQALHDDRLMTDDDHAFDAIAYAFEVYQQDQPNFYPYTSKFDAMLRHEANFTEQEARGPSISSTTRTKAIAPAAMSAR